MTTDEQKTINTALTELGDDLPLIRKAVAAIKSKDKAALLALAPELIKEAKEDYGAIKPAIPLAKVGFKTTEFWVLVVFGAVNVWYLNKTGNPIPLEVNAVLGVATSIYTIVRALTKKS
jgi:hypothetical protein